MKSSTITAKSETVLQARLVAIARESDWFMPALVAVRSLRLASWCIGAGAVRNLVWDALHGRTSPSALADVDVAYFDAADISSPSEELLQRRLYRLQPDVPWEVTNQAGVHQWFEACFGHAVEPLASLEEAVASWPEYTTCVGLWLDDDDAPRVIAPHGLGDLFGMIVRRNPQRVSIETYRQRIAQKRYRERWPECTVVSC